MQVDMVLLWAYAFLAAFANGLYICFHGIKFMDRYLSDKKEIEHESISPFERFARMHRYSFISVYKGDVAKMQSMPVRIWVYMTSLSLMVYWGTVIFIVVYKSFFLRASRKLTTLVS